MKSDFSIKPLTMAVLPEVARIHKDAFRTSALTKLGLEPVRRYYEWQLSGPHDCYAIGAFDEAGKLSGYCFGGVFRGALSGFLQKNQKFLVTWIITHPWLVFNPLVIDRFKMALSVQKRSSSNQPSQPVSRRAESFGILSIAVDPCIQGKGIGRLLMDASEFEARRQGYQQMHLTVHPSNTQAVAFYEGCGWIRSKKDGETWNGNMVKIF